MREVLPERHGWGWRSVADGDTPPLGPAGAGVWMPGGRASWAVWGREAGARRAAGVGRPGLAGRLGLGGRDSPGGWGWEAGTRRAAGVGRPGLAGWPLPSGRGLPGRRGLPGCRFLRPSRGRWCGEWVVRVAARIGLHNPRPRSDFTGRRGRERKPRPQWTVPPGVAGRGRLPAHDRPGRGCAGVSRPSFPDGRPWLRGRPSGGDPGREGRPGRFGVSLPSSPCPGCAGAARSPGGCCRCPCSGCRGRSPPRAVPWPPSPGGPPGPRGGSRPPR